ALAAESGDDLLKDSVKICRPRFAAHPDSIRQHLPHFTDRFIKDSCLAPSVGRPSGLPRERSNLVRRDRKRKHAHSFDLQLWHRNFHRAANKKISCPLDAREQLLQGLEILIVFNLNGIVGHAANINSPYSNRQAWSNSSLTRCVSQEQAYEDEIADMIPFSQTVGNQSASSPESGGFAGTRSRMSSTFRQSTRLAR